jgi:hypothetical protein
MADKYNFNYLDYHKSMDVLERAHRVGKLKELMEKGDTFDWEGIPPYKS